MIVSTRGSFRSLLAWASVAGLILACEANTTQRSPTGTEATLPGSPSGSPGGSGSSDPNKPTVIDPMTGMPVPGTVVDVPPAQPVLPFDPLMPDVYASKVKDILTGLPLSDVEYQQVKADASVLKTLIDGWMTLPSFKIKMFEFFTQAFQQDGAEITDLNDQYGGTNINGWPTRDRFLSSLTESFARTAWETTVVQERPFTETVTGASYMLNLPLMVTLAYVDAAPVSDNKSQSLEVPWLLPNNTVTATYLSTSDGNAAIPLAETLDPTSPNYMMWTYTPSDGKMACGTVTAKGAAILQRAFQMMMGFGPSNECRKVQPVFTDEDWDTYRLVTVRRPNPGETKTSFWSPEALRGKTELVLDTDRLGFMTTPAFFGRWATNDSNEFRVTANQTLVVAIGKSIEPVGTAIPLDDSNLEGEHAAPGTACYACHVTLDPARDFFRQSYSVYYSRRLAKDDKLGLVPTTSTFTVFDSPAVVGSGVADLAQAVANHPLYPSAWAQKFCEYANSGECSADDPEILRIGEAFKAGGYQLKALIRETFASPVVTLSERTLTSDTFGAAVGIARREVFCQRLGVRLGVADACNLSGQNPLGNAVKNAAKLALGLPNAGFGRGDPRPVLPRDPNLFFMKGTEKLCAALATGLIGTATPRWAPADKEAAFDEFTSNLMGIPRSDPRFGQIRLILSRHYDDAVSGSTSKSKETDALRSAFTVACSSPLAVSSGL